MPILPEGHHQILAMPWSINLTGRVMGRISLPGVLPPNLRRGLLPAVIMSERGPDVSRILRQLLLWSGFLGMDTMQYQAPVSILNLNFEEGSGNTAVDSSGFGNHGAINGAMYTTESAIGSYALSFDGNDTVTVPGNGSLKPASISVALWVKHMSPTTSNYGGIIQGAHGNGFSAGFRILDYRNQALAEMNFGDSGPIWIYGSPFVQGAWCHLVLTYDHVIQTISERSACS